MPSREIHAFFVQNQSFFRVRDFRNRRLNENHLHALCQVQDLARDVKSVDGDAESAMSRSLVVGTARLLIEHAVIN
jgi:hypothetical protein